MTGMQHCSRGTVSTRFGVPGGTTEYHRRSCARPTGWARIETRRCRGVGVMQDHGCLRIGVASCCILRCVISDNTGGRHGSGAHSGVLCRIVYPSFRELMLSEVGGVYPAGLPDVTLILQRRSWWGRRGSAGSPWFGRGGAVVVTAHRAVRRGAA
jgi:hypothetical protein